MYTQHAIYQHNGIACFSIQITFVYIILIELYLYTVRTQHIYTTAAVPPAPQKPPEWTSTAINDSIANMSIYY